MSEKYPGIKAPLVNKISFGGMNLYRDNLLLGTATEINYLKSHKTSYVHHLSYVAEFLQDHDHLAPIEGYLKEFKLLIKFTSSGPSYNTPTMVKTEALDPKLA